MEKIKKNIDFQKIYNEKEKFFGKYVIVYISENNEAVNRYGIVASKKVGNAVVRNRVKRLIKESILKKEEQIKKGYDIIIISKRKSGEDIKILKLDLFFDELTKILKKAGKLL